MPDAPPSEKIYSAFFENAFSPDLKIAFVWLVATIFAVFLPVLNESPVRAIVAVPVVLFLPGYCLIAALFPGDGDIDLIERIALSFGLSIAVVPLIGLGLNFTPWGIRLEPIVISLTVFTLAMILVAHYRRSLLPAGSVFRFPFPEIAGTLRNAASPVEGSRTDRILSLLLVIAILAAVLTTVYVIVVPKEGERFTEFFLLGAKQKAADYPDRISAGQSYPMYIGVGNHEYRNVTYTVETWVMDMEFDSVTNTSSLLAMDPLSKSLFTLADNETTNVPYNLSIEKTGYNRVEFLLFNESVPGPEVSGGDRINASYRDLHLWVTVRSG